MKIYNNNNTSINYICCVDLHCRKIDPPANMKEFTSACKGKESPKCCAAYIEQIGLPELCEDPNSKDGSPQLAG